MLINIDNIKGMVYLGVQGETLVTQINIDCTSWLQLYPTGIITIEAMRPGDLTAYTVSNTTINKGIVTWNVSTYDTQKAGNGTFQVKLTNNNTNIKISQIIRTLINPSQVGPLAPQLLLDDIWFNDPQLAEEQRLDRETISGHIIDFPALKNIVLLGIQGEKYVRDI